MLMYIMEFYYGGRGPSRLPIVPPMAKIILITKKERKKEIKKRKRLASYVFSFKLITNFSLPENMSRYNANSPITSYYSPREHLQ